MAKRVLLVGGATGIGGATKELLFKQGAEVITASRGPGADLPFDARDESAPSWSLPAALDGLVYFPGTIRLRAFTRLTVGDFWEDLQVNCLGAVRAIQAALPALKEAESASIVLFSTVAVAQGLAMHASVATAKGAVEGLALSLAAELAPRIRVNVVAPSLTDTPLAAALLSDEKRREASANRHPLKRIGDPADSAAIVAFLLSDQSKFMTGQVLRPDGGLSSIRLLA